MRSMKKTVVIIVLALAANLTMPDADGLAAGQQAAQNINITEHDPQGSTTMAKNAPKQSGGKWLWYILGAAAVAGALAALAGGTSSGGGTSPPATGSYEATW